MIDDDDVNFVGLMGMMDGWSFVWLAVFAVVLIAYCSNVDECAKRSCPLGMTPKLMKHECLCVTVAR